MSLALLACACGDDAAEPTGGAGAGVALGGSAPTQGGGGEGEGRGAGGPVGGAADGGSGGAPPTTEPTIVRVMDSRDEPAIAFDVIANGPGGELIGHEVTDVEGVVEIDIPPNGSVSLLYTDILESADPVYVERRVETIVFEGIAPPEVRFVPYYFGTSPPEPTQTMALQVSYPPKVGASNYLVRTQCVSGSTGSTTFNNASVEGCTSDGLYDVLVVARDASDNVLDYAILNDRTFTPGGSNVHSLTWSNQPVASISFSLSNIPTAALSASVSTQSNIFQGGHKITYSQSAYAADPPNQIEQSLQHLLLVADQHCDTAQVSLPPGELEWSFQERYRCSAVADSSPFEFDVSRLSRFDPESATLDPLTMHWSQSWSGEDGDVLSTAAVWAHDDASTRWTVHRRPAVAESVFPQLPAALMEYQFAADDVIGQLTTNHLDTPAVDGFDAMVVGGLPYPGLQYEAARASRSD